jgi:hypothetical protein
MTTSAGGGGTSPGTGGSAAGGGGAGGGKAGGGGAGGGGAAGAGGMSTGGSAGSGTGGSGGGNGTICSGDCTAVLKTASGKAMDGWASIDPPIQLQAPDGIQGNSQVDGVDSTVNTAGTPCQPTENRTDHGLPLKVAHWQLVGPGIQTGAMYKVTIHLWGVVGCKLYTNNCPQAPFAGRDPSYDLWCPGGADPANATDHFSTYVLSVTPQSSQTTPNLGPQNLGPAPAPGAWWTLNECPASQFEGHQTWMIDFEKTIDVPGGSWINFMDYNTNCFETLNCGNSINSAITCSAHYQFASFPSAVPAPPAFLIGQPAASGAGGFGQWIYFDVRSVAAM